MDDNNVSREFEELERALFQDAIEEMEDDLGQDDPALVRRVDRLVRAEMANTLAVGLLLALGAVFLTIGFATLSWPAWVAGGLAYIASFAVDRHYRHVVGRLTPR